MTPKMPASKPISTMSGEDLGHQDTARLVLNYLQRLIMHHGLWFAEVKHQFGQQVAMEMLAEVSETTLQVQLKHLGKTLGFNLVGGLPEPMLAMEPDDLHMLRQSLAKCWLANDGIWFQAVEQRFSMNDAKRCNDSCWALFSPVEAGSIKAFLGLGKRPGLDGLQQALGFRLYEGINQQSVLRESADSVVFRMTNCRVQSARKRKNLPDYPCKSAGLVEYSRFASAIDERIVTECIGCPPDPHPEEWYCAWRFVLPKSEA